jgi:hypothetical protein
MYSLTPTPQSGSADGVGSKVVPTGSSAWQRGLVPFVGGAHQYGTNKRKPPHTYAAQAAGIPHGGGQNSKNTCMGELIPWSGYQTHSIWLRATIEKTGRHRNGGQQRQQTEQALQRAH